VFRSEVQLYGIRDPTAPNEILADWLAGVGPDPRRPERSEDLSEILRADTAQILDLHGIPLDADAKVQLSRLRRVKWLRLSTGVTARDLEWLGRLKQLRGLSLVRADLAGADFRELARLKSLRWLNLSDAKVSPTNLRDLARLTRLESLFLAGEEIGDDHLCCLAEKKMPALASLGLERTSVTDRGIQRICRAYDLEYLGLSFARQVTKRSVASIARMKRLQLLAIGMSGICPDALPSDTVQRLSRLLPNCRIDYGD